VQGRLEHVAVGVKETTALDRPEGEVELAALLGQ
jgi:hypothetical protein